MALTQLHLIGVGVVDLAAGGFLYLLAYLTLAPVLGAVDKFDIMNLRTIASFVPLQFYGPVEMRFVTYTELGQNRLDQNLLGTTTVEGNVLDVTMIRSHARLEEKDRDKTTARAYTLMTGAVTNLANLIFDYELKLISAIRRDQDSAP
jgi:hypothetical protein